VRQGEAERTDRANIGMTQPRLLSGSEHAPSHPGTRRHSRSPIVELACSALVALERMIYSEGTHTRMGRQSAEGIRGKMLMTQQPDAIRDELPDQGELRCGGTRTPLRGRALRLILWLAAHQTRINETAPERGQLWLTWKGAGPHSIDGDIRTPL
jgi:hypothetical protein